MGQQSLIDCSRFLDDANKPDEISNEMTIEMARFYYENDYPGPKLPSAPSIDRITFAHLPKITFKLFYVNGEAVGVSYEHLKTEFLIVACKLTPSGCVDRFFYEFSCGTTGRPLFTKKFFKKNAFDSRHPV